MSLCFLISESVDDVCLLAAWNISRGVGGNEIMFKKGHLSEKNHMDKEPRKVSYRWKEKLLGEES